MPLEERMRLAPVATTPPVLEPVTVAEVETYLGLGSDTDDDLVNRMISSARWMHEVHTRRQFITATWTGYLDRFPCGNTIWAPKPPLISVTSITYTDENGDSQTLTENTDFVVDIASEPARVSLGFDQSWPPTRVENNAVVMVFVAGYGAAASTVPALLRQAILLQIESWFDPTATGKFTVIADIPDNVKELLAAFTIPRGG